MYAYSELAVYTAGWVPAKTTVLRGKGYPGIPQVYPEIYQTVVLQLPYITSHTVESENGPRFTYAHPYRVLSFFLEIDGEGNGGEESF